MLHFLPELITIFRVRFKRMLVAAEPVLLPLEFVCEIEELVGASRKILCGRSVLTRPCETGIQKVGLCKLKLNFPFIR